MIILPELGNSSRTPQSPLVNPNVAASAGRATAQLGQSIAGVGDVAAGIALDVQKAENHATVSATLRDLSEREASFRQSLLTDHNYTGYKKRLDEEIIGPARGLITADLPPVVKAELEDRFDVWSSRLQIDTNKAAQLKAIDRADSELELLGEASLNSGDVTAYNERVDAMDYRSPEEKKLLKRKMELKNEDRQQEIAIMQNPAKWLEDNPDPNGDPAKYRSRKQLAKTTLLRETQEASAEGLDLILENKISSPEEIDKRFPDLRPAARERLKGFLADHVNGKHQAAMNDPQAQAYLSGTAQQLIDGYDPNGDSEAFDADFVKIDGLLRQIKPGATRDELNRRLDKIRSGKFHEVESNADAARAQLKKAFDDGVYGKQQKQETGSLREILDDGFLYSEKNESPAWSRLKRIGLNDKEIQSIKQADSEKERLDLFRKSLVGKEWEAKANPREVLIIDAIQAGKGGTTEIPKNLEDGPQQGDPLASYGRALEEINQFIKLNPDAKTEQLNTEIQNILGGAKAYDIQKSLIPSRPSLPPVTSTSQDGGLLPPINGGFEPSTGDIQGRPVSSIPSRRGRVENGYAVGKASTYWDTPEDDNGMTSVGIKRKDAPWWKDQGLPTIALAPETVKAMGLRLPSKVGGSWDISESRVIVEIDGTPHEAVYAENGMFKDPKSFNKLIDLSEQFQQVAGVRKGATLDNVKVRPFL